MKLSLTMELSICCVSSYYLGQEITCFRLSSNNGVNKSVASCPNKSSLTDKLGNFMWIRKTKNPLQFISFRVKCQKLNRSNIKNNACRPEIKIDKINNILGASKSTRPYHVCQIPFLPVQFNLLHIIFLLEKSLRNPFNSKYGRLFHPLIYKTTYSTPQTIENR